MPDRRPRPLRGHKRNRPMLPSRPRIRHDTRYALGDRNWYTTINVRRDAVIHGIAQAPRTLEGG